MVPLKKKKEPKRIIHTGGREFRFYTYFDESAGEEMLDLPNFQENPEYTPIGICMCDAMKRGNKEELPV